jgi:cyclase
LVHQGGLVKTRAFKDPKYVGDPINAVRIFNEKEADELTVFDIDATVNGVEPDYRMIANLAAECRMPLCYGGGIRTPDQAKRIISLGVEKVALSASVVANPRLVTSIADAVGRQSVVAVLDVRKKSGLFSKGYEVVTHNAKKIDKHDPFELAKTLEDAGAGEIVINCVDHDGVMKGYDLSLASRMRKELNLPLTFLGGAGSFEDIEALLGACGVVGASAGSLFVFKGPYRAVLISYPTPQQKDRICEAGLSRFKDKA